MFGLNYLLYTLKHLEEQKMKIKEDKMKKSKYPIIKVIGSTVVLFTKEKCGHLIESDSSLMGSRGYGTDWNEGSFSEHQSFLDGKAGEFSNKEQRDFLIKLAENHGICISILNYENKGKFIFLFNQGRFELQIIHEGAGIKGRKIFNVSYLVEEMDKVNAEVEQQLEEAIKGVKADALIVDDIFPQSEWPKAGDKALLVSLGMTMYNRPVKVTYVGDGVGCYVDLINGMERTFAKSEVVFKKIKTPEEELTEELAAKGVQDVVILANQIVNGEFDCIKYIPKEDR